MISKTFLRVLKLFILKLNDVHFVLVLIFSELVVNGLRNGKPRGCPSTICQSEKETELVNRRNQWVECLKICSVPECSANANCQKINACQDVRCIPIDYTPPTTKCQNRIELAVNNEDDRWKTCLSACSESDCLLHAKCVYTTDVNSAICDAGFDICHSDSGLL